MFERIRKRLNKKGFTLVELIVVLAVLGIIAAIAVPKFTGIREDAVDKADALTAAQIVKAARLQHLESGTAVTDSTGDEYDEVIGSDYFQEGVTPQSDSTDTFDLTYNDTDDEYTITWDEGSYTEGDDLQ